MSLSLSHSCVHQPNLTGSLLAPKAVAVCKLSRTRTRVPVYALFENIESGATVNEFLEWFPEVQAWQVEAVLRHEADSLKTPE